MESRLVELGDEGGHVRHVLDDERLDAGAVAGRQRPLGRVRLVGQQLQLGRSLGQQPEGRRQFETVGEERRPSEDVEAEPGARHGHHQTADVAQVADLARPHQRQQDVVVLLALVLVDRVDLGRPAQQRVAGAALLHHVADQRLLAVVPASTTGKTQ